MFLIDLIYIHACLLEGGTVLGTVVLVTSIAIEV